MGKQCKKFKNSSNFSVFPIIEMGVLWERRACLTWQLMGGDAPHGSLSLWDHGSTFQAFQTVFHPKSSLGAWDICGSAAQMNSESGIFLSGTSGNGCGKLPRPCGHQQEYVLGIRFPPGDLGLWPMGRRNPPLHFPNPSALCFRSWKKTTCLNPLWNTLGWKDSQRFLWCFLVLIKPGGERCCAQLDGARLEPEPLEVVINESGIWETSVDQELMLIHRNLRDGKFPRDTSDAGLAESARRGSGPSFGNVTLDFAGYQEEWTNHGGDATAASRIEEFSQFPATCREQHPGILKDGAGELSRLPERGPGTSLHSRGSAAP